MLVHLIKEIHGIVLNINTSLTMVYFPNDSYEYSADSLSSVQLSHLAGDFDHEEYYAQYEAFIAENPNKHFAEEHVDYSKVYSYELSLFDFRDNNELTQLFIKKLHRYMVITSLAMKFGL